MLQCCVRPSVVVVVVYNVIVAKRCVLEQKLLFTAYKKSYVRKDWYQNMTFV